MAPSSLRGTLRRLLAQPGTVLLDTARPDDENQESLLFADPIETHVATTPGEVPALLDAVDRATCRGRYCAGYIGYEAGFAFERFDALTDAETPPEPLAWIGVYDAPQRLRPRAVDDAFRAMESAAPSPQRPQFAVERDAYLDALRQVKAHIEAGDVYQINYTAPLSFQLAGDPVGFYRALRRAQRVPYGAYLHVGSTRILSGSPELFFRRTGERITTRPMKGTVRRGRTRAEDERLADWLAQDPKSRAENLMIVDLLRNDLSRCCTVGSVEVPELFRTEPYETVTQMTSTVIGRLRDNVGYGDLMRGLFPCGSVTGAPKIRAMEIIRQLEMAPRGVYCGAIGYFGPDRAALSVAIRTAVLQPEKTGDAGERWAGRMGIGSGVVWDSDPAAEYDECLLKGRFLSDLEHGQSSPEGDLELIETMRAEAGTVSLLDRHAARLADSAAYFGFAFEADAFRQRVHEAARALDGNGPHKLRATLDRYGRITVEATPLDPPADGPWRLTVAPTRVDADNPYRYHKTTRRDVYDEALAYAQEHGCDEALLRNGDGVVTEGSYTNVFAKIDGTLYTPPVDEGVLGGVYRAYVLDTRDDAAERTLTPDDLRAADALYVCNAVRGWNEAVLMEAETTPADTSAEKAHPVRAQP